MTEFVCICRLCLPDAVEYFDVVDGYWLFETGGAWGLMVQPGHGLGDCVLKFPARPWPDPDPLCEHDGDEIAAASDKWLETVCDWDVDQKMPPEAGYWLVDSCKKAGWGVDGGHPILLQWLFDRVGKMLAEHEAKS